MDTQLAERYRPVPNPAFIPKAYRAQTSRTFVKRVDEAAEAAVAPWLQALLVGW